ncbi:adenosine receptor A2a [Thrips palmi]|uniref:Adenosine receptor A2a n=1 Tax=Thrips palmi TaxID=161013 RepID=A0A6P8Y568_THRPL|nr:adenosine receptor A2a [Thrips palmi]
MAVDDSDMYLGFDAANATMTATMTATAVDDAGGGFAGLLNDSTLSPSAGSAGTALPDAVTVVAAGGSLASLKQLNVPYAACEALVAVVAVAGNALVILAFQRERRLRRRTNYYIVSLAVADLLVGLLGIPFALLASVGLPHDLHACLFTVSLLVVLCTISIFCLVAVSVDRYWAILHPLGYSRNVSTRKAVGIICVCWVAGTLVGFLPLLGWHRPGAEREECYFTRVMDYNYLVFLYFFTIIFPALILAAFYAHIYQVVLKQLRRMERQSPGVGIRGGAVCGVGGGAGGGAGGGTMLRVLGAARKREVKATQNLSIIVLFFVLCWFPLYTINCVQAFCPQCYVPPAVLDFCIILSHLNSAGNPLLYAYHLKDFRAALRVLLLGPGPGADLALDFGPGLSTGTSRTPLAGQRTCLPAVSPSPSRGPPPPMPLATISNSLAPPQLKSDSLWSLQPRYVPAPLSLTPSRSASRSASDCGSDSDADVGEAKPSAKPPQQLDLLDHPQQSPRSPKPRLSPLRAVGEFFFNSSLGSGCAWMEDVNGKASSASTEPLDLELDTS